MVTITNSGLIACLFLDLFQNWTLIKRPWIELLKMVLNMLLSLAIGLLPGVDNNAHVGGFIYGILAGILFMPKIYYSKWDKRVKYFFMILSVPLLVIITYLLANQFYFSSNTDFCQACNYFNCIPQIMPWCNQKIPNSKLTIYNSYGEQISNMVRQRYFVGYNQTIPVI